METGKGIMGTGGEVKCRLGTGALVGGEERACDSSREGGFGWRLPTRVTSSPVSKGEQPYLSARAHLLCMQLQDHTQSPAAAAKKVLRWKIRDDHLSPETFLLSLKKTDN